MAANSAYSAECSLIAAGDIQIRSAATRRHLIASVAASQQNALRPVPPRPVVNALGPTPIPVPASKLNGPHLLAFGAAAGARRHLIASVAASQQNACVPSLHGPDLPLSSTPSDPLPSTCPSKQAVRPPPACLRGSSGLDVGRPSLASGDQSPRSHVPAQSRQ
jgi:hypothetical protein